MIYFLIWVWLVAYRFLWSYHLFGKNNDIINCQGESNITKPKKFTLAPNNMRYMRNNPGDPRGIPKRPVFDLQKNRSFRLKVLWTSFTYKWR